MGNVTRLGEAGGDLVFVLLLGWGYDGIRDLRVVEVVVVELQLEGNDAHGASLLELLEVGAPGVSICPCSDSIQVLISICACSDPARHGMGGAAGGVAVSRTVVQHFWLEDQAFLAFGRARRLRVYAHAVEAGLQGVVAAVEGTAHTGNVSGVEDAGGRGGDGALEEGAVQHLHGAVDGRCEHVGGLVRHGFGGQEICSRDWMFVSLGGVVVVHESLV